ncbi:MAG: SUMF1/EgtB/PvdO family nonheme iron enzyme [Candidatus Porifericomitaceae bacterium WSBS_2022_MAG_OTU9]
MQNQQRPTEHLLDMLAQQQSRVLRLGMSFASQLQQQFHQSLSPLGWHSGHCVYTEDFWLHKAGADASSIAEPCDTDLVFSTNGMNRDQRSLSLPPAQELLQWLTECILDNRYRLAQLLQQGDPSNEFLHRDFLPHFLTEHAAQHSETMVMIATQQVQAAYSVRQSLTACAKLPSFAVLAESCYSIGISQDDIGYDNEKGCHTQEVEAVKIATTTVTNSMWLAFMHDRGYQNDSLWSAEGLRQRTLGCWSMPGFWRRDRTGKLYSISAEGPMELDPIAPVTGVSLHEAQAFATWANARLPHEYEWEAARKNKLMDDAGIVWEWCSNTFHPYPNFRAFPYKQYSVPHYNGQHYVLRGGSAHTAPRLKRPSFRNFYTPEARYLYSGVRLAADAR